MISAKALGRAPAINPASTKYRTEVRQQRISITAVGTPRATTHAPAIKNNGIPTMGKSTIDCSGFSVKSAAMHHRAATGTADAKAIPSTCLTSDDMRSNYYFGDDCGAYEPLNDPCFIVPDPCPWAPHCTLHPIPSEFSRSTPRRPATLSRFPEFRSPSPTSTHEAIPDTFPHLSIFVPQWGHIHPPNSICDLSIGRRRRDIGVTQFGQRTGPRFIPNRPLRSVLTTNTPTTRKTTKGIK
jgi:hypothetical protein